MTYYLGKGLAMLEGSKERGAKMRVSKKKGAKKEHACYILITCGHPSADGKMSVELTYDGDPTLASYLLENVQCVLDQDEDLFSN